MLARLANAGKALSIQRERKLGRSSAREKKKWLRRKGKLDLPEERCTQRTLRQCGIGPEEPLRPRPRVQVTEEEVTRRAVARVTLEEWQAWMQNGGEDLPVTTVLAGKVSLGRPSCLKCMQLSCLQQRTWALVIRITMLTAAVKVQEDYWTLMS
jgi:hypothetical protein